MNIKFKLNKRDKQMSDCCTSCMHVCKQVKQVPKNKGDDVNDCDEKIMNKEAKVKDRVNGQ